MGFNSSLKIYLNSNSMVVQKKKFMTNNSVLTTKSVELNENSNLCIANGQMKNVMSFSVG